MPFVQWPKPYRIHICRLAVRAWASLDPGTLFTPKHPRRISSWRALAFVAGHHPTDTTTPEQLWPDTAGDASKWEAVIIAQKAHHMANPNLSFIAWSFHSWNVTSMNNIYSPASLSKRNRLAPMLDRGPVALQETHWDGAQRSDMQISFSGLLAVSSPAVPTFQGGTSGGVALLIPTYLGWEVKASWELVRGYCLAVRLQLGSCAVVLWTLYLRPGEQAKTWAQVKEAAPATHPLWTVERHVLCGDLNAPTGSTVQWAADMLEALEGYGFTEITRASKSIGSL